MVLTGLIGVLIRWGIPILGWDGWVGGSIGIGAFVLFVSLCDMEGSERRWSKEGKAILATRVTALARNMNEMFYILSP